MKCSKNDCKENVICVYHVINMKFLCDKHYHNIILNKDVNSLNESLEKLQVSVREQYSISTEDKHIDFSKDLLNIKKRHNQIILMNKKYCYLSINKLKKDIKYLLLKTHPDKNLKNPNAYLDISKDLIQILNSLR